MPAKIKTTITAPPIIMGISGTLLPGAFNNVPVLVLGEDNTVAPPPSAATEAAVFYSWLKSMKAEICRQQGF